MRETALYGVRPFVRLAFKFLTLVDQAEPVEKLERVVGAAQP